MRLLNYLRVHLKVCSLVGASEIHLIYFTGPCEACVRLVTGTQTESHSPGSQSITDWVLVSLSWYPDWVPFSWCPAYYRLGPDVTLLSYTQTESHSPGAQHIADIVKTENSNNQLLQTGLRHHSPGTQTESHSPGTLLNTDYVPTTVSWYPEWVPFSWNQTSTHWVLVLFSQS